MAVNLAAYAVLVSSPTIHRWAWPDTAQVNEPVRFVAYFLWGANYVQNLANADPHIWSLHMLKTPLFSP